MEQVQESVKEIETIGNELYQYSEKRKQNAENKRFNCGFFEPNAILKPKNVSHSQSGNNIRAPAKPREMPNFVFVIIMSS